MCCATVLCTTVLCTTVLCTTVLRGHHCCATGVPRTHTQIRSQDLVARTRRRVRAITRVRPGVTRLPYVKRDVRVAESASTSACEGRSQCHARARDPACGRAMRRHRLVHFFDDQRCRHHRGAAAAMGEGVGGGKVGGVTAVPCAHAVAPASMLASRASSVCNANVSKPTNALLCERWATCS
jgi:hypothetical protein